MIVVVANPSSGGGKGRRLLPGASAALRALGREYREVITEDAAHPERAAREAADEGADVVVAIGGDGHVGACANGVLGSETALAIVPAGAGNDFARAIGLDHKRPLSNLTLLDRSPSRRVDAVRAEGPGWSRSYVCIGGTGFDSEANDVANRITRVRGTARYVLAVLKTLARFQPEDFVIRMDGDEYRLRAMMIAVANAPSYGGGMKVCPDASVDDGLADVCVVGAMSKLRFLATFPKVFTGRHVTHPAVTMLRGAKVEIDASRKFAVYGDGEPFGPLPATFTTVPGALKVVAP